ncbi:BspA family leucine-rich repeat surface protein [Companilactobacillus heilongjiangensis]|nr:BspA family leucine-rich repeat surface protein [Companilactobacillus heilongjiangensis]
MTSLKYMDSLGISGSGKEYVTTNMSGMFKNDSNLERVFLNSSLDTKNVTDMSEMFSGVSKLQNLDISEFDMRKVTNSNKIFEGTNLERITLGARNKFSKKDVIPNKNKLVWRAIDEDGNLEKDMTFSSYESNGHTLSEYYDGMGNKGRQTFIVNYHVLIIPSNLGDQVIENITVNSGNSVNVKVPVIKGYTADKKDVTAFINNYGTITTEEIVHYTLNSKPSESNNGGLQKPSNPSGTGNNSSSQTKPQKDKNNTIKANVTISTNLGDIKVQVSGKANEKKTVDVPQTDGYTSDKKTVTVLINANGTATTSESVKYIKNTTEVVRKNTLITTFNDKGNVILYNLDGTKLTRSDRMLASNTDWFSDRQVTIDGILYLRVATNEWIKGSNVYSYQSNIENVKTKRLAMLVNTHGQRVKDRALQTGTSWFTDRIVMINGNKYYRVATNELVSADDIY